MPLPELDARHEIDAQLEAAGWVVQDMDRMDLYAARGVAVREFPLVPGFGRADYMLYVDQQAVGVVEAKPAGTSLTGVEPQGRRYADGLPRAVPAHRRPLPFIFLATGVETRLTNLLEPDARSRGVFHFLRPETLLEWTTGVPAGTMVGAETDMGTSTLVLPATRPRYAAEVSTLRHRLRRMPPIPPAGLWPVQLKAVRNLEESLARGRPRALIQMATGSGKTFTAVTEIYRLIKHAGARRVLFLVDRANLGRQALREFQGYATPDDGRTFTELYNVQHLTSNSLDHVSRVCISTIQRLYSMLQGEAELAEDADEHGIGGLAAVMRRPVPVTYNPDIPVEYFDIVFIDECHRSIYTLWRQVLEYFDAFLIGLTATPGKQTLGFFDQYLVMEYGHQQAVADQVNVGYDIYRIRTRISEQGSHVESGLWVDRRDRETRRTRWERLDEDLTYEARELDRSVVAPDQIRTIVRTFRDRLSTEIFPGRTDVPKTLIFAKDDSHADDIVRIVREEFDKSNEFAQKITYKTTGAKTDDLIKAFRNSYLPRIAVTVDMIATGTDIKPLEVVMFMRDVKSRVMFEQMKGRGVRVIGSDDLRSVTPDSQAKTRFVLVDCVGVTEREEFNDSPPLERKPTVSLEKLLNAVKMGNTDPDVASTLASRLSRLALQLTGEEETRFEQVGQGTTPGSIAAGIVEALDPDRQVEVARELYRLAPGAEPAEEQRDAAEKHLIRTALKPLANPDLRDLILDIKRYKEQTIDQVSRDELLGAGFDDAARERAEALTVSFEVFLREHRDDITALQLLYGSQARTRLTHDQARELANAIETPPKQWTPEALWQAYEALDGARVHHASRPKLLSNIVRLVRFAIQREGELVSHPEAAQEAFARWMDEQATRGREFTEEQRMWLEMIRDHVAANLEITNDDFEYAPFAQRGGLAAAYRAFGGELRSIMAELEKVLAA